MNYENKITNEYAMKFVFPYSLKKNGVVIKSELMCLNSHQNHLK
jgi:hypothetical protein